MDHWQGFQSSYQVMTYHTKYAKRKETKYNADKWISNFKKSASSNTLYNFK